MKRLLLFLWKLLILILKGVGCVLVLCAYLALMFLLCDAGG